MTILSVTAACSLECLHDGKCQLHVQSLICHLIWTNSFSAGDYRALRNHKPDLFIRLSSNIQYIDCKMIYQTKQMWTLTWRHLQRLQSPLHCLWRWRWSLHLQALRVQVSLRSRQRPHPAHLRNIMETTCYYSSHRALKSCECIEQIFMILSKISGWTEPWLFLFYF